jgi:hypothetical protein
MLAIQLAPMGLHAVEAVTVATGNSITGRDPSRDDDDEMSRCDGLAGASPYVAELRTAGNGAIEIRQWAAKADSGKIHWTIIPDQSSSSDGWRPARDVSELHFTPPLATVLATEQGHYLVFTPAQASDATENEQMIGFISAFGPADGTFRWRGRVYEYAVSKRLPCFATES